MVTILKLLIEDQQLLTDSVFDLLDYIVNLDFDQIRDLLALFMPTEQEFTEELIEAVKLMADDITTLVFTPDDLMD